MDVAENTPTFQKAAIFKALFPLKNKKKKKIEKMKSYPHLISSILIGHNLPTSSAATYCIILQKKEKKLNIFLFKQTAPTNKETELVGKIESEKYGCTSSSSRSFFFLLIHTTHLLYTFQELLAFFFFF